MYQKKNYFKIVKALVENHGFIYLPHPREVLYIDYIPSSSIILAASAEEYMVKNQCHICISVYSTVNLNINLPKKANIFIAKIVGAQEIAKNLESSLKTANVLFPKNQKELEILIS